jgi:hypothetical protein
MATTTATNATVRFVIEPSLSYLDVCYGRTLPRTAERVKPPVTRQTVIGVGITVAGVALLLGV